MSDIADGAMLVEACAACACSLFASANEEVVLPLHAVGSVDVTGAGDAMTGALAVALVAARSLRSAATTLRLGAPSAMSSRAELEAWLAREPH